jgi:signal transduction histidine kinase
MNDRAADDAPERPKVAWNDILRFIRQLSHDLRNHLNAAELQSAYINELSEDAELKTEIKRLREMLSTLAKVLQSLSVAMASPKPELIPYRAADFVEDLGNQVARDFPQDSVRISWNVQVDESTLNVDPQLLSQAFVEIFRNAFQHEPGKGAITATAKIDNGRFTLAVSEPKQQFDMPTENWGLEPLRRVSRGHYALGLSRARSIVEAHNGQFGARYDSTTSTLVTTITLPLAKE